MSRGLAQVMRRAIEAVGSGPGEATRQKLQRGRMIASAERQPPSARVEALFNCPPERVWTLLNRHHDLPDVIDGLHSAKVLHRGEGETTVEFAMKLPFPIGKITWTNRISSRRHGDVYGISWRLLSGDLLENSGRLVLTRYNGDPHTTYANYLVQVQTRAPLPQAAQRLATRWLLPRIVKRLRTIAEDPTKFTSATHEERVVVRSPLELLWAIAGGQPVKVGWCLDDKERQQLRSALGSCWPRAQVTIDDVAAPG